LHTSQTQINSLTVPNYQFEDVLIGPIVEPEDKLVDVGLKVLGGYAMVDTDYCSLEQAPECAGVRPSILGFHCLMNAVGDDADGGTVQPHEVSHLFGPILVNVNSLANPLVEQESGTGWLNYLNSFLNSCPVVFPAARRPMRLAIFPFFTAEASFQRRRNL